MRLTIDALDAWWPPTFTPERFSRTRLAWWTIAVASQSTRRSIASSVSRSGAAGGGDGARRGPGTTQGERFSHPAP